MSSRAEAQIPVFESKHQHRSYQNDENKCSKATPESNKPLLQHPLQDVFFFCKQGHQNHPLEKQRGSYLQFGQRFTSNPEILLTHILSHTISHVLLTQLLINGTCPGNLKLYLGAANFLSGSSNTTAYYPLHSKTQRSGRAWGRAASFSAPC